MRLPGGQVILPPMFGIDCGELCVTAAATDWGAMWAGMWSSLNPMNFSTWIEAYPEWAWLIAIGFAFFVSLTPLPMETIAIMNGMWFGPRVGAILTWVGAILAAMFAFFLAKVLGYPLVKRFMPKRMFARMEDVIDRHGAPMLIMVRMIPLIPFTVINYGAGSTTVHWRTFLWTSALGFIPPTIMWVYVGNVMRENSALGVVLLTVIAVAMFFIARRLQRRWDTSHAEASD